MDSKTCMSCGRTMPLHAFKIDPPDKTRCRTCEAYRGNNVPDVELYESTVDELILKVAAQVSPDADRIVFDELFYKMFNRSVLAKDWKLPVWINKKVFCDD